MKGVTHYFVAAALVSMLPMVMWLTVYEKSFIIVLGAIAGILPDYIDFKIVRFLWPIDDEIIPDWPIPDAQEIANKIARIIDETWEQKRPFNLQLHTIKTGPSTWRRWYVHFDTDKKLVKVGIGPIQTFGGKIFEASIEDIPPEKRVGEARFSAPLVYGYKDKTIKIRILSGPLISFVPKEDHIEVVFLPWHRHASHSVTLAGLLSFIVFVLCLGLGMAMNIAGIYGLAFFVGFVSHIITDQPGYMGSNLFWPFTKTRIEGFKITESMDPYANFGLFWTSIGILFWNMNYSISPPPIEFPLTYSLYGLMISPLYILLVFVIPWIILIVLRKRFWKVPTDVFLQSMLGEEYESFMG